MSSGLYYKDVDMDIDIRVILLISIVLFLMMQTYFVNELNTLLKTLKFMLNLNKARIKHDQLGQN